MSDNAIETVFLEIEDSLKYRALRKLSESEHAIISSLENNLMFTDTPIADTYFKVDEPLFGLFHACAIKNQSQVKSVELVSLSISELDIPKLETFVDTLYDRLKDKTVGQGRFKATDLIRFKEKSWSGKLWVSYTPGSIIKLDQVKEYLIFLLISRS